jgi:F-type H+-transporting ATPase subunit b
MPQIAQLAETFSSQIFWLLLTFGLIFFVVGMGMLPKVQSTVDARDAKIAEDLATAKAAFARGDEVEEAYRVRENESRVSAQQILAKAKVAAAKDTEKKLAKADTAVAKKIAEAEEAIRVASAKALGEIEQVSTEAALEMVAKISGTAPSADAAAKAVKAALLHG